MSKFEKNLTLSHKEIRGKRAELITEDVRLAQEDYLRDLTDKKRELARKLMNLEDLSPDNELSLHPGKADFDAKKWIKEVNDTELALVIIEQKIEVSKRVQDKFFGEEEVVSKPTVKRTTAAKTVK